MDWINLQGAIAGGSMGRHLRVRTRCRLALRVGTNVGERNDRVARQSSRDR